MTLLDPTTGMPEKPIFDKQSKTISVEIQQGDILSNEQLSDLINAINKHFDGGYVVALVRPNVKELLDNASRIAEGVMEKEKGS